MTTRLLLSTALATLLTAAAGTQAAASGPNRGQAATAAFWSDVAHHLGVTPQALQQALKAASLDRVAELKLSGRISQAEAATLTARIQTGHMHFGVMPWAARGDAHHAHHHGMRLGMTMFTDVAGYLGMTPEALRQQLEQGKTLRQIAKAQGKSVDGLQALMTARLKTRLETRVRSGEMTTAESQRILARFTKHLPRLLDRSLKPAREKPVKAAARGS